MNHSVLNVARTGNFKLESNVLAESNVWGNIGFEFFFKKKKSTQRKRECPGHEGRMDFSILCSDPVTLRSCHRSEMTT